MSKNHKLFNRKVFYSIVLSAVVDWYRRLFDIDVRWPGSVGNNRVFSNRAVGRLHKEILIAANRGKSVGMLPSGWEQYQRIPFFF
ncbi:hypothetical protein GN244_ATG03903 [Phytophthora infestans]|uniref:Uncharacterized protein n=1 Tax=Phytophthora infestans TaxID=4787 RepID=A0A833SNP7_PHYIN|nr:hypothetical protein GN244_ATG03903 [Phytophthora infestans]KAF4150112.1 hypothetical protein GN958_ATG00738 [Phytophthora infestans]